MAGCHHACYQVSLGNAWDTLACSCAMTSAHRRCAADISRHPTAVETGQGKRQWAEIVPYLLYLIMSHYRARLRSTYMEQFPCLVPITRSSGPDCCVFFFFPSDFPSARHVSVCGSAGGSAWLAGELRSLVHMGAGRRLLGT